MHRGGPHQPGANGCGRKLIFQPAWKMPSALMDFSPWWHARLCPRQTDLPKFHTDASILKLAARARERTWSKAARGHWPAVLYERDAAVRYIGSSTFGLRAKCPRGCFHLSHFEKTMVRNSLGCFFFFLRREVKVSCGRVWWGVWWLLKEVWSGNGAGHVSFFFLLLYVWSVQNKM